MRESRKKVREAMSERDHDMLEKIRGLPGPLQEKFIDRLDGAAMAMETLTASGSAEKGEQHGSDSTKPG